jgi:hypothetical protein
VKLPSYVPILLTLTAAAAGLSCADIASPSRSEPYEWRRIVSTGPTTADTLSFHWPRSRLPVRIWTQNTLNLPQHVDYGIAQWKAAFLYKEFDAVQVADSNVADVIVSVGVALKSALSVMSLPGMAPECEGATEIELPPASRQIQLPIRVFVNPRFDPATPGMDECLELTTAHELGHALGIFNHSPDPGDLMYSDPVVAVLSVRDRDTAERAYHIVPNLTVADR